MASSDDRDEERGERLISDDAEVLDAHHVAEPSPTKPLTGGSRRLDVRAEESRYTSPLPSPEDLRSYESLLPGAAERLLSSGEREQAHRHQLENRLAGIDEVSMPKFYEGQRRGHLISLVLGIGYLLLMLAAVLAGAEIAGVVGAAAGLAAMVWAIRRDSDSGGSPPTTDVEASS